MGGGKDTGHKHVEPLIFIESINVCGMSQCVVLTVAADTYVSTMGTAEIHVTTGSVLITRTYTEIHLGMTSFCQTKNKIQLNFGTGCRSLILDTDGGDDDDDSSPKAFQVMNVMAKLLVSLNICWLN